MQKKVISVSIQLIMVVLALSILLNSVFADPTGATVTFISNSTKNASSAESRTDEKGTITTVVLDAMQQDYKWKAYVGNVTSTFTLDDEADYTIYQWNIDHFSGEVFATRASSTPAWSSINCSTIAQKQNEDYALNHSSSSMDSINQTFVTQTHKSFVVADRTMSESSCYAIATWINDSSNTLTTTASFQEVILSDGTNIVYATFVENDKFGYMNDSTTYDFQMIVAENATITAPDITYYFYVELESG
ncbi:hypothetical protein JXB41_03505 [Candidatus Woesearchaeota archaeon]|nr:hypothetical protein [Candidatus Woesearchaeota archaeon]